MKYITIILYFIKHPILFEKHESNYKDFCGQKIYTAIKTFLNLIAASIQLTLYHGNHESISPIKISCCNKINISKNVSCIPMLMISQNHFYSIPISWHKWCQWCLYNKSMSAYSNATLTLVVAQLIWFLDPEDSTKSVNFQHIRSRYWNNKILYANLIF